MVVELFQFLQSFTFILFGYLFCILFFMCEDGRISSPVWWGHNHEKYVELCVVRKVVFLGLGQESLVGIFHCLIDLPQFGNMGVNLKVYYNYTNNIVDVHMFLFKNT